MAVTIVLFHAGVGWMWNVAVTGVTFFFLSSTFLLAMRHPFERLTARGYGRFAVSHALRLYPLHWLGLALLVALGLVYYPSDIHWGPTALSALLIHSWFPAHDIHYGINPVAWYLCALLFCYLIYPFMAHCLGRWRLRYKVMLAVILAAALAIVLLPLDIPGREAVFVNPLSHVLDIVVGLILIHLYHLLKARAGKVSFGTATLIECGALVLLAVAIGINMATTWVKPWEDVLIWLVPQGCILLVLALLDGHEGAIGKVLLFKPLQWLGSISFEVYVLQFVAFHLFNYLLSPLAGHFGWLIYDKLAWLSLLLLVPLAWAVNRLFTRPLRKMINAKFKTT